MFSARFGTWVLVRLPGVAASGRFGACAAAGSSLLAVAPAEACHLAKNVNGIVVA
jgi:hypothetical protein